MNRFTVRCKPRPQAFSSRCKPRPRAFSSQGFRPRVSGSLSAGEGSVPACSASDAHDARPTKSRSRFVIFFANITIWGPKVEHFFNKNTADVQCIAEHHLSAARLPAFIQERNRLHRRVYATAAVPTGRSVSGTSAGVAIMAKSHLYTRPPDPDFLQFVFGAENPTTARWTATSIRLRSMTINVVTVYLFTAEGLSLRNLAILEQILLYIQFCKGPSVVVGDWQVTPQELQTTRWMERAQLVVANPAGVTATCATGFGGARLLDYFLVSPVLMPLLLSEAVYSVPWKPHIGLLLSLSAHPRSFHAPTLISPRPLPLLPSNEVGLHDDVSGKWEEATALAHSYIQRKAPITKVKGCTPSLLEALHPIQVAQAQQYAQAYTSLEYYHLLVSSVPPPQHDRYIGRGHFPFVDVRPLVPRSFLSAKFYPQAIDLWASLETCIGWIMRTKDPNSTNLVQPLLQIRKLVLIADPHWSRAAAPNCPMRAWLAWSEGLTIGALLDGNVGYTRDRLEIWQARALAQKRQHLKTHLHKRKLTFKSWLEDAMATNVGQVHKYVKADPKAELHPESFQDAFDFWGKLWHASSHVETHIDTLGAQSDLVTCWSTWSSQIDFAMRAIGAQFSQSNSAQENSGEQPSAYTAHDIRDAADAYPAKKSLGCDAAAVTHFRDAPTIALQLFAVILNAAVDFVAWPPQILINLLSLIPKPLGGTRPIVKTPILYRMWCVLVAPLIKAWSRETSPTWDYAVEGKSALMSAANRQWCNELAILSNNSCASNLWDMDKFFDTINLEDVRHAANKHNYPSKPLKLALAVHSAPRMLRIQSVSSQLFLPFRSILQGCMHSSYMARLILIDPVQKVVDEQHLSNRSVGVSHVSTDNYTFVDDVAQQSIGHRSKVARSLVQSGLSFAYSMRALRLVISNKSTVVASDHELARSIATVISKHSGVKLSVANTARDLGICNNPTGKRSVRLQVQRLTKAKSRLRRIAPMSRVIRRARLLATTGAFPQALWGQSSIAVSNSTLAALRTAAAAASGIGGHGRCATTAIALAYGPDQDPAVRVACDQASLWFDLFRADSRLRALTVRHWSALLDRTLTPAGHPRMNNVLSPASGFVVTMNSYGWKTPAPHKWIDPKGEEWVVDMNAHKAQFKFILKEITTSVTSKLWLDASKFFLGKGLQGGVDWHGTTALLKQLRCIESSTSGNPHLDVDEFLESSNENWPDRALSWLELFLCGGYWPASRAAASLSHVPPRCPRCHAACEDAFHLIWTCPANARIDSAHIRDSQSLIQQAREGKDEYPCVWLRGLLPLALLPNNTPFPAHDILDLVGSPPLDAWPSGKYYTDGSGGEYSDIPALRRCAFGIAHLKPLLPPYLDPNPVLFGAHGPLPGFTQTVPRSELFAVLVVIQKVAVRSIIVIVSDSAVTVDGFRSGRACCMSSPHSDLWEQVFDLIEQRHLGVTLLWVKSHWQLSMQDQYPIHPVDLIGNSAADSLANHAALQCQVIHHDAIDLKFHYALIRRIQARAIAVLSNVVPTYGTLARPKSLAAPRAFTPALGALAVASRHTCTVLGPRMWCHTCQQVAPFDRDGLRAWLQSACIPDRQVASTRFNGNTRPVRFPPGRMVRIGWQTVHPDHVIMVYRGLLFCRVCGHYASKRAIKLAEPCRDRSRHAKLRAAALLNGQLPSGLQSFPNDRPLG